LPQYSTTYQLFFKAKGVRVKSPGLLYTIKAKLENMCGSGNMAEKIRVVRSNYLFSLIFIVNWW